MEKIKKGSLVRLDFIGYADGEVFDTTLKEIAEKNNIDINPKPVTIVIGKNMILQGLEEFLIDKTEGEYLVKLPPEKAFGEKKVDNILIIPISKFRENNLKPYPGMVINVDGVVGRVKNVGSGRVIVDFNHPLAGKEVEYKLFVRKVVNNEKEKVETLLKEMRVEYKEIKEDKNVGGKKFIIVLDKKYKEKKDELENIKHFISNTLDLDIDVLVEDQEAVSEEKENENKEK